MLSTVLVESSARHVHLTVEQIDILFPNGLTIKKELSIAGNFAYNEKVFVRGTRKQSCMRQTDIPRQVILGVTVLGPARKTSQLELSKSDLVHLGIKTNDVPERLSGDITGAPELEVFTEHGSVMVPLIVSMRHLHVPEDSIYAFGLDVVNIEMKGTRGHYTIKDVPIRPTPGCEKFTLHIDTDESNAFGEIEEASIVPLTHEQVAKQMIVGMWKGVEKQRDHHLKMMEIWQIWKPAENEKQAEDL